MAKPLLFAVLLLTFGYQGQEAIAQAPPDRSKLDPARIKVVRAMYAKLPADILGIREPIRITDASRYKDGGTIGLEASDVKDKPFKACFDGRLPEEAHPDIETYHVYIGAIYPTEKGAMKVQVRGPEEAALYGLLLRWAQEQPKSAEVAALSPTEGLRSAPVLYEVHRLLRQFDERYWNEPPVGP